MGSSGGGGGSSGEVSWPTYLEGAHEDWLIGTGVTMGDTYSVTQLMQDAMAEAPFSAFTDYGVAGFQAEIDGAIDFLEALSSTTNPVASWLGSTLDARDQYDAIIGDNPLLESPEPEAALNITDGWEDPTLNADSDIESLVAAEAEITNAVDAFGDVMDDRLNTEILPRFEAGMRDINAVQSSAFVLGRAVIEGMIDRDVANFQGDLRSKAFLQKDGLLGQAAIEQDRLNAANTDGKNRSIGQAYLQDDTINAEDVKTQNLIRAELAKDRVNTSFQGADSQLRGLQELIAVWQNRATATIEAARVKYVMEKEEADKDLEKSVGQAQWDLSTYQYGVNVMAAISGGTTYPGNQDSAWQSAIGGAFAGASLGSQVSGGTPFGAAAGGIIGGIGGYLLSGQ